MSRADRKLARELRALGASKHEAAELARAAERLSGLRVPGMSAASRQRVAARLPVDVELAERPRFGTGVRWAMAGSFAAVAIVLGAMFFVPQSHRSSGGDTDQQAHKVTAPTPPEKQLEQQVQQLEQLQQQPVVNQKKVQKAKGTFEQKYKEYQKSRSDDKDSTDKWRDYKSQWWWKESSASKIKSDSSLAEPQPSDSQPDGSSGHSQ